MIQTIQANPDKRAADGIIAQIEQQISDGSLSHGSALPTERAMMEAFGASRPVVREAITALSSRGLIDCKPRHRPTVRQLSYKSVVDASSPIVRQLLNSAEGVRNLYDTRVFVECALARHAAKSANNSDILALRTALEANEAAILDATTFYLTDIEFHKVFYAILDNPVFQAVHTSFVDWLAPQWGMMERSPDRNRENYLAHAAIYQAIVERDPDAAEQVMAKHLETAWSFVRSTFNWDI